MANKKLLMLVISLFVLCLAVAACNKNNDKNPADESEPKLSDIRQAVVDAYGEEFTATYSATFDEFSQLLSMERSQVDDFFFNTPAISADADIFIGVKAAAGQADNVETALNNYKNYLINDSMQYPMNQAKVKNTTVTRYGNYVFLVMLGDSGSEIEDEAEAMEHCKQQNRIGTDAIAKFFE